MDGSAARQLRSPFLMLNMLTDPRIAGLLRLIKAVTCIAPGASRIGLALMMGFVTHLAFACGVLAMIVSMFFGMSESLGRVQQPWGWAVNIGLILQFPILHSLFLTPWGNRVLSRLIPGVHGVTLATSSYALIASLQLFTLFAFWTPSGVVFWRAEGLAFGFLCCAYAASWLLLLKASFDAGAEVQSGALGWMSLLAGIAPRFPDMPVLGLFRIIRQPIYVAFALTLWTVPVWTPDQIVLASVLTAYCLLAPRLKERRFITRYGERFAAYRAAVPYVIPKFQHRNRDAQ